MKWMLYHFSVVEHMSLLYKSSRMWPSIVLLKNPPSKNFWSFSLNMIKESFQYNFVILLTHLCFWRADMLIDHPSAIKEGDQHHFVHRLWLTNLFGLGLATMEPCLWLTFHFRTVMMNPGFINNDDTRKSGSWEIHARFSEQTERWCSISADSLSSLNALCHSWMVESCKVSFWKSLSTERSFLLSIF